MMTKQETGLFPVMMMSKEFEAAIYDACLKSAIAMGDRIKTMSWFGKNRGRI